MTSATEILSADDVIITDELDRRPSRAPDHERESLALRDLARTMATEPDSVLQCLVEAALTLTRCDSVGVSLLRPGGRHGTFHWVAATGAWAPYLNGRMPREASPCGEVVARDTVLLMKQPERAFPALLQAEPAIQEALLVPFHADGQPIGTVWAIKHGRDGQFDREDARLLLSLSGFAAAGHQMQTALHAAQASDRESAAKYRGLFDAIDEGFCIIEVVFGTDGEPDDYCFLEVNTAFEFQTGLTGAVGKSMRSLRPEHEEYWFERYSRIAATGTPERFEERAEALGRWYDVYAFRVGPPDLRQVGILFQDINERKQTEASLRESEARYRLLIGSLAQAIWETDAEGVVVADSPSWRAYTGQSLEEWLGYGWLDAIHPEDQAYAERQWREATATRGPVDAEFRLREADGGWRWTNVRAAPVLDEMGNVERWAGMNIDIDARKRAETAMQTSEEKFRMLFDSIEEGFAIQEMIYNDDGVIVDIIYREVNKAFERQGGVNNAVDRSIYDVIPGVEEHWLTPYREVAKTGQAQRIENYQQDVDRWFDVYFISMDKNGRFIATVFNDITARKQAEIVLRESEERQTFLLKLSDLIRPMRDTMEIQRAAVQRLGEHLNVSRSGYYEVEADQNTFFLTARWEQEAVPLPDRMLLSDFGDEIREGYRAGRTMVARDTEQDAASEDNLAAVRAIRVRAWIGVPLVKDGRWVAAVGVHSAVARDWTPSEIHLVEEVGERTWAAVERARVEAALRESEERHAFLLKLSDALRPLADSAEIARTACRMLVLQLGGSRAQYTDLSGAPGEELGEIRGEHVGGGEPMPHRFPLAIFGEPILAILRSGRSLVMSDAALDPRLGEQARKAFLALGAPSTISVPLLKGGRWTGALTLHDCAPRDWSEREVRLAEHVAERTWAAVERAKAEAAFRDSEQRFAQFAASSSDTLWIRSAETLDMEYVSPASRDLYGIAPDALLGAPRSWSDLIVPEDRENALAQAEAARRGESVTHEFRIVRPSDGEERWIRNIDFPLLDSQGRVQRIGGIASDVTDDKRAAERLEVLVNELQHRSRNLLGVITAVAGRTLSEGGSVAGFEARLKALSRAQGLLSQQGSDTVELGALVRAELAAHADPDSGRQNVFGPPVHLTARQVQNFALALHELTTNAVKYGALKAEDGQLSVTWQRSQDAKGRPRLILDWIETGVALPSETARRRGSGRELIENALSYALRAKTDYGFGPDGVRCRIELPLG